jgi:hypothetical protein
LERVVALFLALSFSGELDSGRDLFCPEELLVLLIKSKR